MKSALAPTIRSVARSLAVLGAAFSAPSAQAVSGTWLGTTSFFWDNPANWSSLPEPGSGDTATFNNAGFGGNSIGLPGPVTIRAIVFDTASAASYDIGSGDTLTLDASGAITMNASVAVPQNIGASLNLGTASAAEAFSFTNHSTVPDALLFFAGVISSGANTGVKNVTVTGAGVTEIHGSITNGAGSVVLTKTGTGTLNFVPGSILSFDTLTADGGTTNVNAALGSGGTTVVANANLKFGSVSQTLASLTIGAGATVTFTSGEASFAGSGKDFGSGATVVPEPGTLGLLLVGALGVLGRRRRA